jgi:transposase
LSNDAVPVESRPPRDGASSPLEQVCESAQALVAEGHVDEAFDFFVSALEAVLCQNRDLELLVAKLRRERVGKSSERVDPGQLSLLFEQLAELGGQEEVDLEAEAREDAELDQQIKDAEKGQRKPLKKARKPKGNWRISGAERQVHHVEVPEEERTCVKCGREKQRIGEDTTSLLEFVPGHFVEHEYHKAKYACGTCKQGVTTAPGPSKLIERSAADASVLAHVVVSKYADHCPLHRLHRIYERSGVTIPVSTMSDWTGEVGVRIEPLVDRLVERVRQAYVIGTDATGLKVLDSSSSENIERGTMWCYVGDGLDVVFRYTPTGEGASGPWEFLAGRTGYVQADAASVFDRLYNGQVASAVEVGCWSHGRRRLVALRDTDCRVACPLKLIARLYRIEHLADARQLSPDERASLRQERSQPVLEKLKRWLLSSLANEPPSSELAKAIGYLLNQWTALNRFVEDGRLSLDNNLTEQQMRDIALGRKNYLFAGSHDAARRAAALYSLMRSCAQRGVPPLPYLTDVLRKLADGWKQSRLDELLPHRWEEMHGHSSSR